MPSNLRTMMIKSSPSKTYAQRIESVLSYIEANVTGDLSVETLRGIATFSKFHFHRPFTAFVAFSYTHLDVYKRRRRAEPDWCLWIS